MSNCADNDLNLGSLYRENSNDEMDYLLKIPPDWQSARWHG